MKQLVWAISAKNSLSGHQGYSPNMLVFALNPNYPNVLTSELPALETQVSSVTVENNLKTMSSAREAFIQSECSEKIKRAVKHKVRSCNDAGFENGDKVYYKLNNNPKWKEPGYVIGQENKNVLVKHGGELIRVHPASLLHVHTANSISFEEIEQSSQQTQQKKENESQQKEEDGSQQKENNKSNDEVDMSDDDSETPDDNETPENNANKIHISNKEGSIIIKMMHPLPQTRQRVCIYLQSNRVSHAN